MTTGTWPGCPSSLATRDARAIPARQELAGHSSDPVFRAWRRQAALVTGADSKSIGGASLDDAGWMLGHPQYPALRP